MWIIVVMNLIFIFIWVFSGKFIFFYIIVNLEDGEDFFDYIVSYVYKNFLLGGGINIVLCVIFINLD